VSDKGMTAEGASAISNVQLVLPPESAKSLFNMLIASMVFSAMACLLAVGSITYSIARVNGLSDEVGAYKTDAKLAQYDASELRDTIIQDGIKVPLSAAEQADAAKLRRKP